MPPSTNRNRVEFDDPEFLDAEEERRILRELDSNDDDIFQTSWAELMRAERERRMLEALQGRAITGTGVVSAASGERVGTRHPAASLTNNERNFWGISAAGSAVITTDFAPLPLTAHPRTISNNGRFNPAEAPQPEMPTRQGKGRRHLSRNDRMTLHNPAQDEKKIDDLVVSDLF